MEIPAIITRGNRKVYELVKTLPKEETYALGDQMRRAAVSVPANIAEGQARQSPREFAQYLAVARGSLAELDTLLEVGRRIGYWQATPEVDKTVIEVRKLLQGLMNKLTSRDTLP